MAAAALISRPSAGKVHWRRTWAYDLFMRAFGSVWFLLLAFFVAYGTVTNFAAMAWPQLVARSTLIGFYLILWFLIIARPPMKAESTGILPRIAAFVGTYFMWGITFAPMNDHVTTSVLSTVLIIGGMALTIISVLRLGRAFSIVPQARGVVRTGFYGWVRHPLYLAEEIAVLGVMLQFFSVFSMVILLSHIAVQICRIRYEEALLRKTLPEYAAYAAATRWRLIPYVW